jgi:hypothetical protein
MPPFWDKDVLDCTLKLRRETPEVLGSAGQKKRRTAGLNDAEEVCGNHLVAGRVIDKRGIDIVNRYVSAFLSYPKLGVARNHLMFERGCLGHCGGTHAEASRAALHVDDRMVTVFSRRGRREADDVLGLHLLHHLLEGKRRDMVALVDDYLTALGDKVLDFVFPVQALDDRNIYTSRPVHLPAADLPNRLRGQIQERCQPLVPLIEQLLPVNARESSCQVFLSKSTARNQQVSSGSKGYTQTVSFPSR